MGKFHQPLLVFVTFLIILLSVTSLSEGRSARFMKSDPSSTLNDEKTILHLIIHGLIPGLGFPGGWNWWVSPLGWLPGIPFIGRGFPFGRGGFPFGRGGFPFGLGGFPFGRGGFPFGRGGFGGYPNGLGGFTRGLGGRGGFSSLAQGEIGEPEAEIHVKSRRNSSP